ncbi:MAG: exodeoxyribonuclease VII small subunit [Muribaculaceae bacterium]|nr:exodeoxyribonuclease VII small subunit [Muribaculaceae bacterium]
MEEQQQSFNRSLAELEKILAELRSDSCDVDTLTQRTRRAVELLTACRSRLTATEEELRAILATLQSSQS